MSERRAMERDALLWSRRCRERASAWGPGLPPLHSEVTYVTFGRNGGRTGPARSELHHWQQPVGPGTGHRGIYAYAIYTHTDPL